MKVVFANNGSLIGSGFEVSRTNITELNREEFECSDDPKLYHDGYPGRVLSPDGPKDLQDCIEDYYHRELKCQIPWGKKLLRWVTRWGKNALLEGEGGKLKKERRDDGKKLERRRGVLNRYI